MPAGDPAPRESGGADDIEAWFERGVTDGLPVVPPSRARVEAMLATTRRRRDELVAEVPPNFGRATVEKLAVNAVMAGCRPDYFPVVLAVVEAACDPVFNLHGQSGTTNAASPYCGARARGSSCRCSRPTTAGPRKDSARQATRSKSRCAPRTRRARSSSRPRAPPTTPRRARWRWRWRPKSARTPR